jgi:AcrR family transcriptional regulator
MKKNRTPSSSNATTRGSGTSRKRSTNRNELLRDAALKMAAQLFAERGFAGTNLQNIADALGISRPGLYYYFSNKEEILEALIEELTIAAQRQSAEIADREELDPAESLRLMTGAHAQWLLDHGLEFRVVDRNENDLPPRLRERHQKAKRAVLSSFTAIIERGIASGRFRPVDPQVAAFAIIGMCSWTAWWFRQDGRMQAQDVAKGLSELGVRGLLRGDSQRSRSDKIENAMQTLQEDVAHLQLLLAAKGSR